MKSKQLSIKISIKKAKPDKLFYFVSTGVIYHPKLKKCLILQRSKKETAHGGLWGVTGGKLEHSDMLNNSPRKNHDVWDWNGLIEILAIREAKEESNLVVGDPKYLGSVVFRRPDRVPVVCTKFALKYKSGEVQVAPEFDDYKWVDSREVKNYKTIDGIDKEIAKTIKFYSKK